jgi:hypothetical protein
MVQELRQQRAQDIKTVIGACKLLVREMKKHALNAEQERKLQEEVLDADFPKWRDGAYDDTGMDRIVPVIPGELLSKHKLDLF